MSIQATIKLIIVAMLLVPGLAAAQEDDLLVDTGPGVGGVVAGQTITLTATVTGASEYTCIWQVAEPIPRFSDEDTDKVLGEDCTITLPGEFTAERHSTRPWQVAVQVEDAQGRVVTDTVAIQISPDTTDSLIVGYVVIAVIILAFVAFLVWRRRSLHREIEALKALDEG